MEEFKEVLVGSVLCRVYSDKKLLALVNKEAKEPVVQEVVVPYIYILHGV